MAALFTLLVTAVCLIPFDSIDDNTHVSAHEVVQDSTMFNASVAIFKPFKVGDFTDGLMLDIAWCVDSHHPFQSAMTTPFVMMDGSPVHGMLRLADKQDTTGMVRAHYGRYWHGNQAFLRPLLTVSSVHDIRWCNIILMALLWIQLLWLMWQRVSPGDALAVCIPMLLIMIPSVPLCMNYVPTFYIALLAGQLMLSWRRLTATASNAAVYFFIIGGCTAFLDLLTTPMVAMAIPLFIYMLYCRPRRACAAVVAMSLAWLAGYASLWAVKWLITSLTTGSSMLGEVQGVMALRMRGVHEETYMSYCLMRTLQALGLFWALMAAMMLVFGKSRKRLRENVWMLLLAMSSFVWVFVLLQHSWHHSHFTWRTMLVALVGAVLYCCHSMQWRQPFKILRGKGGDGA